MFSCMHEWLNESHLAWPAVDWLLPVIVVTDTDIQSLMFDLSINDKNATIDIMKMANFVVNQQWNSITRISVELHF